MTLARSTALRTHLRERKCTVCKDKIKQARPMQAVYGPACAAAHARRVSEKQAATAARADRVATKAALEKFKTKVQWIADLQRVFNAFIRERDRDQPCICCGKLFDEADLLTGGQWNAGHYISRGAAAPALRREQRAQAAEEPQPPWRHHARPVPRRMIARIGLAAVEALEADQTPRHYTIDDLRTMKAEYAAKLRALNAKG